MNRRKEAYFCVFLFRYDCGKITEVTEQFQSQSLNQHYGIDVMSMLCPYDTRMKKFKAWLQAEWDQAPVTGIFHPFSLARFHDTMNGRRSVSPPSLHTAGPHTRTR